VTNTSHSMGEVSLVMSGCAVADDHYREALRTATDAQSRGNARLGLAKVALCTGHSVQARLWGDRAEQEYRACDDPLGIANVKTLRGDIDLTPGSYWQADEHYAAAENAFGALGCLLNVRLVRIRRLITRQIGWDSPQLAAARNDAELLIGRTITVDDVLTWPLAKKGSVFHGALELDAARSEVVDR
jgi:hypothetical protein